jgi:hypothetical protein
MHNFLGSNHLPTSGLAMGWPNQTMELSNRHRTSRGFRASYGALLLHTVASERRGNHSTSDSCKALNMDVCDRTFLPRCCDILGKTAKSIAKITSFVLTPSRYLSTYPSTSRPCDKKVQSMWESNSFHSCCPRYLPLSSLGLSHLDMDTM